jgi:TPR repeat protein
MRFRTKIRACLLSVACLVMLPGLTLAQEHHFQSDPQLAAAQKAMDAGDWAQSLTLFKQAAADGKSAALEHIAQIYLEGGKGVKKDYAAAMAWAQKAADAGRSRGYLFLGQIWMKGLGVSANLEKALAYFKKADAEGDMKAGRYVGLIAQQRGDDATAAKWFRKAAEAGDITSQYYLGRAYETGRGVPRDYAEAMKWYRTSASRGDIIASDGMVGMAGLYEKGEGVPRDLAKAKALYSQAAGLGNKAASKALARLGP